VSSRIRPTTGTASEARTAPPTSWLAFSRVHHRRLRPAVHVLTHRTLHVLVDVDDLDALAARVRGFGLGRRAPVSLRAQDHLDGRPGPLRVRLAEVVERAGAALPSGRLQLLAHPRMLGHVFNPVAWWFAHDDDGRLALIVAEVTSTFGDRAVYVLDELEEGADGLVHASARKRLHVSPFLPVEGLGYRFSVLPPDAARDDRVLVHMEVDDAQGTVLTATQDARMRPFDTAGLRRALVRHPMASLAALGAIHASALRLWRLRVPFHRRPTPPDDALKVGRGRTIPPEHGDHVTRSPR
jgi:uncharacterized protein